MLDEVHAEDRRVGLPVEGLDPVDGDPRAVARRALDDHDDGGPRLQGDGIGRGLDHREEVAVDLPEPAQQVPPVRRGVPRGPQAGRDRRARGLPPRDQALELLDRQLVGDDEVVDDPGDRPSAGGRRRVGDRRRDAVEQLAGITDRLPEPPGDRLDGRVRPTALGVRQRGALLGVEVSHGAPG